VISDFSRVGEGGFVFEGGVPRMYRMGCAILVISLLDSRVFATTATCGVKIEEVHTCCLIGKGGLVMRFVASLF
jgi:hypothetical protein